MKTRLTEQGIIIPKDMLVGIDEIENRRQAGMIIVVPVSARYHIFDIDRNPIDADITDASENQNYYIYRGK